MPQITLTVADGNDDTCFYNGTCYRTSGSIYFGYDDVFPPYISEKIHAGFRFQNVPLGPQHRIITARLNVKGVLSTTQVVDCRVGCDDVDDSADFVASCDASARTMTTAYGLQTETTTVANDWVYLVDIASAVQEVLNRPGWVTGNALSVLVVQQTSSGGAVKVFSYDDAPSSAPQLVIDYQDYAGGAMI